jgi:hypothetical protein
MATRKNFLKPESENILQKREQFAVSLRKEKTKSIVQLKRRKIAAQMLKNQSDENCGNIQMNAGIEDKVYHGYPQWRGSGTQAYYEVL